MMIRVKLTQQQIQTKLQKVKNFQNKNHRQPFSTAAVSSFNDDTSISDNEGKNPHFPNLFNPLDLGPVIGSLPNRVIMGSMHTGLEVRTYSLTVLFICFLISLRGGDDHHNN